MGNSNHIPEIVESAVYAQQPKYSEAPVGSLSTTSITLHGFRWNNFYELRGLSVNAGKKDIVENINTYEHHILFTENYSRLLVLISIKR